MLEGLHTYVLIRVTLMNLEAMGKVPLDSTSQFDFRMIGCKS